MNLWRISNYEDLSGEGGRRVEGRWHEQGTPAVYLAEHAALSLLEVLVHLEIDRAELPSNYKLLTVDVPDLCRWDEITRHRLDDEAPGWRTRADLCRGMSMPWFAALRTPLLRVPSVILPKSHNFVLNPMQADAGLMRIVEVTAARFDTRLWGPATPPSR